MNWQIPLALGGPVLQWELVRASRRLWPRVMRYLYVGFLLLELVILLSGVAAEIASAERTDPAVVTGASLGSGEKPGARFVRFCWEYVTLFLQQQLVLLILATPAVVAGAIGDEKERGTLQFLLTTELEAREIITGKLLARLGVLALIGLIGLPYFLFMAGLGGLPVGWLLLGFLQAAVVAFTLAGAALLTSVWTEHTRDAIIGCYAFTVLVFLSVLVFLGDAGIPIWLNPFEVLQALYTPPYSGASFRVLGLHFLAFGGAGLVFVGLATARLRTAALRQLEGRSARARRWLFVLRPPIRDNPVRWRERHVIGLAPLPWLRRIPRWLGMLGVFSFSAILLLSSLRAMAGQGFYYALRLFDFEKAYDLVGRGDRSKAYGELAVMGIALIVLGCVVVGVRCAGSITEEKRRRTWEDLMLTPLTWDEIVQGKLWGILGATVPYLAAYTVPMVALGAIAGIDGIILAGVFAGVSLFGMFLAASMGMSYSAGAQDWK